MAKAAAKTPAGTAARTLMLEGREKKTARVAVEPAGPAHRVSLRAPAESLGGLSRALGVKLPEQPLGSAFRKSGDFADQRGDGKGGRAALWLDKKPC